MPALYNIQIWSKKEIRFWVCFVLKLERKLHVVSIGRPLMGILLYFVGHPPDSVVHSITTKHGDQKD